MSDALRAQGRAVCAAATALAQAPDEVRCAVLLDVADRLEARLEEIVAENALDLAAYDDPGPGRDRLTLTPARVGAMAQGLRDIAALADPLFEVAEAFTRPNGLRVEKVRVPLGVVGVLYENRPNVTCDVAGLCVRSGNAAFLRGSSSAQRTNEMLVGLWHEALDKEGLPAGAVSLVADPSREAAVAFMGLVGVIDCLIPRGGPSLIAAMREHARVPYVLDGDGNCHVYVDRAADLAMARAIVANAKTSRPGVCNAAETLLVHAGIAPSWLPGALAELDKAGVAIHGDERVRAIWPDAEPATQADWATEYLALILAVRVVDDLDEALAHIARWGTRNSEAVVARDIGVARRFARAVDSGSVFVNCSTRFSDGGEFGYGLEIGVSTQKLHARGPMGLEALTCVKNVTWGSGQIRV